jgi:hypothetical protein
MNTNVNTSAVSPANGESTLHDLFALTDEQILEIEPEAEPSGPALAIIPSEARNLSSSGTDQVAQSKRDSSSPAASRNDRTEQSASDAATTSHESPVTSHAEAEPPQWVAEAMNDPQRGREVRAFWEGAQKAQQEAAAYREVFAKPEEARSAAERARVLDDIDRAYFAGDENQRTQLATMMLREDPAAFREMVFEGLRALEKASGAPPLRTASSEADIQASQKDAGLATRPGQIPPGVTTAPDAQRAEHAAVLARYAAFEKAANEDLERSVGSAIERTLEHALPNTGRADDGPMKGRLAATIRQDVEKALQGDRQLGEQVAQVLSARRLDHETRTQVVRLIGERAEQLVPSAAKRALNDWTQSTLAAHRSRTRQNETAAARSDLAPASRDAANSRLPAVDSTRPPTRSDTRSGKGTKVDYRKLSDEQILNS